MKIHGLVPMLETERLRETIEFYCGVLGFECRGTYPAEGEPCWASLWNGEHEIAFGLKNLRTDIEGIAMTGSLYMYVSNVDELWEQLKDKVEVMFPIKDMAYRMREFGIKDPNGYAITLGQDIGGK